MKKDAPARGPGDLVADTPTLASSAADILKALGHPLRLRLVAMLAGGEAHVGALADRLGASQPSVSQQLRILRMHGLVRDRREGGLAIYCLAKPQLRQLLGCVEGCLGAQLLAGGAAALRAAGGTR
jgi:ArsR family transcriptional regulator